LAWAVALAVVLTPAYRFFLRRLHSRDLAAGLTVVLVALILSALAVALLPGLVQTALDGLDTLQAQIQAGAPAQMLEQHPRLSAVWHWIEAKADLAQAMKQAVGYATALASSVVQGSLIGLLEALLVLFFLFYFLRDQQPAVQRLRSLLPLTASETDEFLAWQVDTLYATLFGTLLVGFIQGLLGGLMFWWLGLNAPVFWEIVMGVLCVLPIVWPSLVWGPATVLLALSGHWLKAILLVAWGSIVIGFIGNLLYPILLGRRLRLHTLAVFISMIGGLVLFGACGFFVGPLALAAAFSLQSIWKVRSAIGARN
jgi:predicted PurR-regulated permease PerM